MYNPFKWTDPSGEVGVGTSHANLGDWQTGNPYVNNKARASEKNFEWTSWKRHLSTARINSPNNPIITPQNPNLLSFALQKIHYTNL